MRYLFVFLLIGLMVSCGDDATKEAKGDTDEKKTETTKQLNCDEIQGIESCNLEDIKDSTNNYTGIIKCCKKGKVEAFLTLKDGKLDGLANIWYENGQIQSSVTFKDDIPDGAGITWYENGQMKEESNYKDGEVNGLQRQWYENGQLKTEQDYRDGKQDGAIRAWHENGQLMVELNMKNGTPEGLVKSWHENGQLRLQEDYEDGKLISAKCWNEDGNEIECPEY